MFPEARKSRRRRPRCALMRGLTLLELLAVLGVLAVLSTLVVPMVSNSLQQSRDDVTRRSLNELEQVIGSIYWDDMDRRLPRPDLVVSPGRQDHPQMRYLFVNPATEDAWVDFDPHYRRGWRGEYVLHRDGPLFAIDVAAGFTDLYGEEGDPVVRDGWGRPIVIQNPGLTAVGRPDVRIISAGPDRVLDIPPTTLTADLTAAEVHDDLWTAVEVR